MRDMPTARRLYVHAFPKEPKIYHVASLDALRFGFKSIGLEDFARQRIGG